LIAKLKNRLQQRVVGSDFQNPHPRYGVWSPSKRKFVKHVKKQEEVDQMKVDIASLENNFREDFFFMLDDKDKPRVFLLLKSLKWDVERRIRRAKMLENKELHFPGF
jgi:hypothetical protein